MFYAIPLQSRPTWSNPPWMTLLLILVNMAVFWGPQASERKAQARAAAFYLQGPLPALELPAFVDWLQQHEPTHADALRGALQRDRPEPVLQAMQQTPPFLRQLRAGEIITPAHPRHEEWRQARATYDAILPAPFTARWAQDHNPGAEPAPITWLSSAFLHGSTGHLLGNMLFLLLFGFSVELSLGRRAYLLFYLLGAVGASALASWAYAGQGGLGLGASGAVSALMGMYAVLYRMKRIRFFYQFFFYFNYVSAPALLLLPAWIVNELLQHWLAGRGIAYMAHLGGLLTGAALMALALTVRRIETPEDLAARASARTGSQAQALLARHAAQVAQARRLTGELQFEQAAAAWRAAAKLRPRDAETLRQWFNLAKLWPAGDDFHRCARLIFALPGEDAPTLALQHASFRTYLDLARPGVRLKPDTMLRLAQRFTRSGEFADAEKLCHALLRSAPAHPALADTLALCAGGLLYAGQRERALTWLPALRRLAPELPLTRQLGQLDQLGQRDPPRPLQQAEPVGR